MEENKLPRKYSYKESIIEYSIAAAVLLFFIILTIITGFYWGYLLLLIVPVFFIIDGSLNIRKVNNYKKQNETLKENNINKL